MLNILLKLILNSIQYYLILPLNQMNTEPPTSFMLNSVQNRIKEQRNQNKRQNAI